MNPLPLKLPERVIALCRPAASAGAVTNPHRDRYFTVYVNDTGKRAMMGDGTPRFPRGSIIVKEKLASRNIRTAELLTVMVKRQRGFDPSGGDWEYGVLDGRAVKTLELGRLAHCKSCHSAQRRSDYVFRNYRTKTDRGEAAFPR